MHRSHERAFRAVAFVTSLMALATVSIASAGSLVNTYSYQYDETADLTSQAQTCVPATKCPAPMNCGSVANGCGGQVACGTCALGNACNTSNVCACVAATCAARGPNWGCTMNVCTCTPNTACNGECGLLPNGCGGTLNCGKCSTCFTAGTSIAMADGSTKPIEEVVAGDVVLSYDVSSGALVHGNVERLLVHPSTAVLVRINGDLTTTPEHPFFVDGDWVRADHLRIGDRLLSAQLTVGVDGSPTSHVEVTRLEELAGGVTTYNLEVAQYHDYFAGGVLVHNIKLP